MSVAIIIATRGSTIAQWAPDEGGMYTCVAATSWPELARASSVDAGVVPFHLAERLGLASADGRSVVHDRGGGGEPRFVVTSPRLPTALARDAAPAITRVVTEALAAVAAHNEAAAADDTITTLGLLADDLGGTSALPVAARASALTAGIRSFAALCE